MYIVAITIPHGCSPVPKYNVIASMVWSESCVRSGMSLLFPSSPRHPRSLCMVTRTSILVSSLWRTSLSSQTTLWSSWRMPNTLRTSSNPKSGTPSFTTSCRNYEVIQTVCRLIKLFIQTTFCSETLIAVIYLQIALYVLLQLHSFYDFFFWIRNFLVQNIVLP